MEVDENLQLENDDVIIIENIFGISEREKLGGLQVIVFKLFLVMFR